ncbi:glycoside hydrolase family 38 C-terminal domain-containing protein [Cerasicoccus frondis]|uniref:glycoside hydrolase family 38 N-terminal domain-containing protein n=1 Tax=Cerasicoccus frondis TaxID=490090 RepID=UPI002852A8D6|nr:glycoside hydrolase family 38 C-terminal domain-containing protein [Cerasicoccus frondis]
MTPNYQAVSKEVGASLASSVSSERALKLHLIGNAHLDPVWLWDWPEGMNEGIATCRAMVEMLKTFPRFHFIRGEAALYDYVEKNAPRLFHEIGELIAEGRWEIVGGNWIQPDTNLPATESLLRQFIRGKRYFRERFGVDVTAAWAADSFGHSAGMPEILTAAGMDSIAFTRPQQSALPLRQQAFWWQGPSGCRVLAYRPHDGWYSSERSGISERLDTCLARASVEGLDTAAMFYGLGNHGGGTSRTHLIEIEEWAQRHPEVEVVHSGLHGFFSDLRSEILEKGEDVLDVHQGELNFCLRGCSASLARFKFAYRSIETSLIRSEKTQSALIGAGVQQRKVDLDESWDRTLFNAFHDILPGTSIERAYVDQLAQLGRVHDDARASMLVSLTSLASKINTHEGAWKVGDDAPLPQPVLIWNPHPFAVSKHVEVEVSLDYRPLWQYRPGQAPLRVTNASSGEAIVFQQLNCEHDSLPDCAWRARVLTPVSLAPMGWQLLQVGYCESEKCEELKEFSEPQLSVDASIGDHSLKFKRDGEAWLGKGMQVRLYEDDWGSWGGMKEEEDSWRLTSEVERLTISKVEILEYGPLRQSLWVLFEGALCKSSLEAIVSISIGSNQVDLKMRAFMADRGVRMKLILPTTRSDGAAEFEVPGGSIVRKACGEVPGGRWVVADDDIGFASNALYGFDSIDREFRATIARTSRYASDVRRAADDQRWRPCADMGEHVFDALLTPNVDALPRLSKLLEEPLCVQTVPAHRPLLGPNEQLNPSGSLLEIDDDRLQLLAITAMVKDSLDIRIQNISSFSVGCVDGKWMGQPIRLGRILPGEIITWRLDLPSLTVTRINIVEI